MKAPLAAIVALSALATAPLAAIEVSFVEESANRGWFTVVWGATPTAPFSELENGSSSDAGAIDEGNQIRIDYISSYEPGAAGPTMPFSDTFHVQFIDATRQFSASTLSGFLGTEVVSLPGEPYGAQVVYGEALPSTAVPDASATLAPLSLALFLAAWSRRRRAGRQPVADRRPYALKRPSGDR